MCRFNSGVRPLLMLILSPNWARISVMLHLVLLSTSSGAKVPVVLAYRVCHHIIHWWDCILMLLIDPMFTFIVTWIRTPSFSWKTTIKHIVCMDNINFGMFVYWHCVSVYDYDVWVWSNNSNTLESRSRHASPIPRSSQSYHVVVRISETASWVHCERQRSGFHEPNGR